MGGDGHLRRIHMLWQKMESSQLPKIIQRDGETSQKMTNDVGACGFAFLLEALDLDRGHGVRVPEIRRWI